jgi:hypothetical protein
LSLRIAPGRVGRTIVDDTGFVNSGRAGRIALKGLEKPGNIMDISFDIDDLPSRPLP